MTQPDESMPTPRLSQVNLVVRDMEAMTAFYKDLGLQVNDSPPDWQAHLRNSDINGGLHLDFDSIEFTPSWNAGWPPGQAGAVIGFEVASTGEVDRLHNHLTGLGYESQQDPYDAFWGARYAIVADPDGNSVGLMSPIDPIRATKPPDPPS